jgi:hypothetical protein
VSESKRAFAWVAAVATLFVPQIAMACAVCFTGRTDETRIAFLLTTGLMTALPILLVGSFVWWLVRRARQMREEHEAASPAVD